jgi:small subunit ribosomal protein S24e
MEIKVTSEKHNPMLKRKEVSFQVEHGQAGSTPSRPEIRKAVAAAIKTDENVVFVKKFATRTGTHTAFGVANVYDTVEQAKLVEPEYIVKRNIPAEKTEEAKESKEAQEPKQPKEAKEEKRKE